MTSVVEQTAAYTIGTVIAVSPTELKVALAFDAPQATALNTGTPTGFPRINFCVLIPNEGGAVVGSISRIVTTKLPLGRSGRSDDPLVELPVPVRIIDLTPVGTLISDGSEPSGKASFRLVRGVPVLPSVGDPVLLPSRDQTRSIIEGHGADRRVWIGNAPFASNARVTVDPDKLFGRHLAILGNTGSGKSCSVAGSIRWCLEAAKEKRGGIEGADRPNARFIILDPNGEYATALEGDGIHCRTFAVGGREADHALSVPGWLWNSQEWAAFTNAQPGAQRPILMTALRMLRNVTPEGEGIKAQMRRQCAGFLRRYRRLLADFPDSVSDYLNAKSFGESLVGLNSGMLSHVSKLSGTDPGNSALIARLAGVASKAEEVRIRRFYQSGRSSGYNSFHQVDVEEAVTSLEALLLAFPAQVASAEVSEDAPVKFDVALLPSTIEDVALTIGGNASANVEPLINRIQVMLGDGRMSPIIASDDGTNLLEWLNAFVGTDQASNGEVAVVDLSLVPSDVVHITVSVISRLIFEAVQRYKKAHHEKRPLPTTIVLEEAHVFLRKEGDYGASGQAADVCRQTFERIAREGRKFGLGLLLSSQRPSELSPTVLAQCNTFLLHRIVNDLDQALVRKLVPDALGGMLSELPTLPSQQAILLGWAAPLPILIRMRDLPKSHRPHSDDPDFWDVWCGHKERSIDWSAVAQEWERPGSS